MLKNFKAHSKVEGQWEPLLHGRFKIHHPIKVSRILLRCLYVLDVYMFLNGISKLGVNVREKK